MENKVKKIDNKKYFIAIDQGTTSSRAVIYDRYGNIISKAQKEFEQIFPKPGWVEHDPMEVWSTQTGVIRQALDYAGIDIHDVVAAGITNQRETTVIWDKNTGKPIYNAIVWQCRRTADLVEKIYEDGLDAYIKEKTGLVPDAYFSATKISWILDNVKGARERAKKGELAFGTIDSWLIWNFSRGKIHATDYTNASRTMVYDIQKLKWDDKLLNYFDIPKEILPVVVNSSGKIAYIDQSAFGKEIPITGCAGDQQSSLFGLECFNQGDAKNTYGTGCFLLMNIGDKISKSENGLLTTIAWGINGKITYALEGSIFMGGAIIKWLRDGLGLINRADETESLAYSVKDNGGVYMVPAFTGLGAPYWDMYARGLIIGLTRGTNKAHIVRSALEAISYSTMDVLYVMEKDSKIDLKKLKVDGGASNNKFLIEFQSDLLNVEIEKSVEFECTARGAFLLAMLGAGLSDLDEIKKSNNPQNIYKPNEERAIKNQSTYKQWKRAVERSKEWIKDQQ